MVRSQYGSPFTFYIRPVRLARPRTSAFHADNRGSNPLRVALPNGRLAQLGEHRPYKPRVTGSIPVLSIF
ncbi:hypothetical protein MCSV2_20255 [Mucispirillum schaedleri ASF457]|nr:hypothetical protein MCSV2_20255 [Mucispirillum schaedleri ASF457]